MTINYVKRTALIQGLEEGTIKVETNLKNCFECMFFVEISTLKN